MEPSAAASACYPFAVLPGSSPLFTRFLAGEAQPFYPTAPATQAWMTHDLRPVELRPQLADLLTAQARAAHAGPRALTHIDQLRRGARAVVTGQQVGLFGGPLYTLYKAASAVRLAQDASAATGVPHVPIFWLASEDHDFAEIDHLYLPVKQAPAKQAADRIADTVTVRMGAHGQWNPGAPVGSLRLQAPVLAALDQAAALLDPSPAVDLLRRCYRPEATFSGAFAQWLAATFREQGLIVFDAASRAAHTLGAPVLRHALTQAAELEQLLLARGSELEAAGFHQQVLVKPGASLLFLLDGGAENEPHTRLPLRRKPDGTWTAGHRSYSTHELLAILESEPERLSPNALLRPIFQDAILPTAAYIGGPAEVAYFAQLGPVARAILGRETPVLPRLSVTLIDRRSAATLEHDGIDLPELFRTPREELTQRVGARALPPELKRQLQAAGAAMSIELATLTEAMGAIDPSLGRSAEVAANKMRYQMNRLRRLAAHSELSKDASLRSRMAKLYAQLYPDRHLQERRLGAIWGLARFGPALPAVLVAAAGDPCPGHKAIYL